MPSSELLRRSSPEMNMSSNAEQCPSSPVELEDPNVIKSKSSVDECFRSDVESSGAQTGDPAEKNEGAPAPANTVPAGTITAMGFKVLVLLAVQNCSKNLLMRWVMKEKPNFLTSAAVIGVELLKLVFSTSYILFVDKRSIGSIVQFMKDDHRNSILLAVPAAAYSLQMSLEYVALENIDASVFSVLVQTKLLATASFAVFLMGKTIKKVQVISLVLLTAGVMLCNMKNQNVVLSEEEEKGRMTGMMATLGIALSSGFASVYTEKVIKAQRNNNVARQNYSLAYMQVQLALVSLVIIGLYACIKDYDAIVTGGLFQNFNTGAFLSIFNSAIGGLIVAAVLKFADAVLKGYATAISVILTGVLSMVMFGTRLPINYFMGIINVVCAVLLYNARDLDRNVCGSNPTK
eukprot:scaffold16947_cov43-Attheya_sp.AAC.1